MITINLIYLGFALVSLSRADVEEMSNAKIDWSLRVGLLLTSLSLFSYMLYEFANGIINRGPLTVFWILVTDVPGCIGMASRAGAGLIAVVAILFYVVRRDLSKPEAFMVMRLIVLLEAGYWFMSFFMSGVMGVTPLFTSSGLLGRSIEMFLENTLPCFVQSIGLAGVLMKLFFELNPNKPAKGAIKWGLIAGTFYIFVFWLNNTGNWIAALGGKGLEYITLYPANLLSFLLSTVGLLALALYSAYFSKKSFGAESLAELNLHTVGVLITLVGLYFGGLYIMYIFLGPVGGWGTWYAWLLGHNLDLWAMSLPFVGLPLLFKRNTQEP